MPAHAHIAVTGASAGLGAALAEQSAKQGVQLSLTGRNVERLEHVAALCRARGAEVATDLLDLRDGAAVQDWAVRLEARAPIDTMILNAGLYGGRPRDAGPDADGEPDAVSENLVLTNLLSTIRCAKAIAPKMRARGRGTLVFVSSLAARLPAADAASYAASKAGVSAYAEALREGLYGSGVTVLTAHPGHIRTSQTEAHQGGLPFLIEPDAAARHILKAIARRRQDVSFPMAAALSVRFVNVLPRALRYWLLRNHRFTVDNRAALDG